MVSAEHGSAPPCPVCAFWGRDGGMEADHHRNCPATSPRLAALLRRLVVGIGKWGSEEGGIPDWMWDDYVATKDVLAKIDEGARTLMLTNSEWITNT